MAPSLLNHHELLVLLPSPRCVCCNTVQGVRGMIDTLQITPSVHQIDSRGVRCCIALPTKLDSPYNCSRLACGFTCVMNDGSDGIGIQSSLALCPPDVPKLFNGGWILKEEGAYPGAVSNAHHLCVVLLPHEGGFPFNVRKISPLTLLRPSYIHTPYLTLPYNSLRIS